MKKINKSGFSIVIGIGLVFFISMLVLYIVEYMVPFSKNVKGIENSSVSYYQANSGLEETLYFINKNEIGSSTGKFLTNNAKSFGYELVSTGTMLPPAGEGNSDFDKDRNIIAKGKPIQLQVGDGRPSSFTGVHFYFRVPDLDLDLDNTDQYLSGGSLPIINWQLSSETSTLNASSYITATDISGFTANLDLDNLYGKTLTGADINFGINGSMGGNFYSSNCGSNKCTLKISIINDLIEPSGTKIPYLEWQADFSGTTGGVALRYARLKLEGKSYGFRRVLNVKIPQLTTIEAFDFTVFQ